MIGKLQHNDQCNLLKVIISKFVNILIIVFYITVFICDIYSNHANLVQNEEQVFS